MLPPIAPQKPHNAHPAPQHRHGAHGPLLVRRAARAGVVEGFDGDLEREDADRAAEGAVRGERAEREGLADGAGEGCWGGWGGGGGLRGVAGMDMDMVEGC